MTTEQSANGSETAAQLALGERLDLTAAPPLAADILALAGADLQLDAAATTHFGAPGLQVIRAAAKSWAGAGHRLSLENLSTDCADQLALFGFAPDTVTLWEDAQ